MNDQSFPDQRKIIGYLVLGFTIVLVMVAYTHTRRELETQYGHINCFVFNVCHSRCNWLHSYFVLFYYHSGG